MPTDPDDDRQWGEADFEHGETEDMLGWDASGELVCLSALLELTFTDT